MQYCWIMSTSCSTMQGACIRLCDAQSMPILYHVRSASMDISTPNYTSVQTEISSQPFMTKTEDEAYRGVCNV